MSKLKTYDLKGAVAGEYEVAEKLLELKKGAAAVHASVVAHLAGVRAGTASTLRKGEVAGSNKKPWRQKGTGRARAGYRQSPVWRGGGVAFGPHPRDFSQHVNSKVKRLAFRRALSEKIRDEAIKVVEKIALEKPKTKLMSDLLKSLGLSAKVLCVMGKTDPVVVKAARNMPAVEVVAAREVSVYQIVRYPVLVADRAGMDGLVARLGVEGVA